MPYTNIRVDSSTKRGLFSRTSTLLNKKNDLLDRFDNDSEVKLELDMESASTPSSPEPSFSWAFDEENISNSKWELAILRNAKNPYPPGFEEAEKVIEEVLGF